MGDERGKVGSCGEGALDLRGVAGFAVIDPAEGELEAIAAAAALQREVGEVIDVCGERGRRRGRRGGGMEKIRGRESVSGVELAEIGAEEEGACDGDAHHFVGVDGDGVGEVRPGEFRRVFRGEDGGAAPRGVNMKPEGMGLADRGNSGDGVIGA